MRVGVPLKKIGMTSFFFKSALFTPATLLRVEDCQVIFVGFDKRNYLNYIQVGCCNFPKVSKPLIGHFKKCDLHPKLKYFQFYVDECNVLPVGYCIGADFFEVGQFVDVSGRSIGKGFCGVMKRYGFSGSGASHGTSLAHRSLGSVGSNQDPGRVFKNKKMSGHHGMKNVTVQNLRVLCVDVELNLIVVSGSVPGTDGSYVILKDAVKKF